MRHGPGDARCLPRSLIMSAPWLARRLMVKSCRCRRANGAERRVASASRRLRLLKSAPNAIFNMIIRVARAAKGQGLRGYPYSRMIAHGLVDKTMASRCAGSVVGALHQHAAPRTGHAPLSLGASSAIGFGAGDQGVA